MHQQDNRTDRPGPTRTVGFPFFAEKVRSSPEEGGFSGIGAKHEWRRELEPRQISAIDHSARPTVESSAKAANHVATAKIDL